MSIRWSAMFHGIAFLIVLMSATAIPAQAQFSIRAASSEPVVGWQRMPVERSDRVIWVSPVEAVTAADIEKAAPDHTSVEGQTRVAVVLTEAGAKRLADLTAAQLHKGIAMILDGKVIWAPMVMAESHADRRESILAGSGAQGLIQPEVERIMALVTCGMPTGIRTCATPLSAPTGPPSAQSIPFDICAQS